MVNNKENSKYTFEPVDFLNFLPEEKDIYMKIYLSIVAAIKDAENAINLRSRLLKDYFYEISTSHTKRQIRVFLRICLCYKVLAILFSCITDPGQATEKILFHYTSLFMLLMCYIATIKTMSFRVYSIVTPLGIVTVLWLIMIDNDIYAESLETKYSPVYQIFIIMLSMLPVSLEVSLCIISLYVIYFEITTYKRFLYGTNSYNDTYANAHIPWSYFEMIQIVYFDRTNAEKNVHQYIKGQTTCWIAAILGGVYLHLVNVMRRRASFLRLGENVKAQHLVQEANKEQVNIIGQIMPPEIKTTYLSEKEANKDEPFWVFSQVFDNVSILFADIVGFTNMSSNKTAPQVVTLLNDLFNRFDQLAIMTNCEKLGTLGDCYYCVSGCPIPRFDHAACCVEMGLGMCRIIKAFNKDYNENVDMRIGVHTGRVNAAIIGNQRFRFDCYSNDVLIANTMESSGSPGRVHISQFTHECIQTMYKYEPGEGLSIKKEVKYGVAGMKLTLITIDTYFVNPESSRLLSQTIDIEIGRKGKLQIINRNKSRSGFNEFENEVNEENADNIRREGEGEDMELIKALRTDPDQQIKLFEIPPLWPIMLTFIDDDVETHYHAHTRYEIRPVYVDSVKIAPLIDSIACLIYCLILSIACYFMFEIFDERIYAAYVIFIVGLFNTAIIGWSSFKIAPTIKNKFTKSVFLVISHPIFKNFQAVIICSLPSFLSLCMFDCEKLHLDHIYTSKFFTVSLFAVFTFGLFVSSFAWISTANASLFVTIFILMFLKHPECYEDPCLTTPGYCNNLTCMGIYEIHNKQFWNSYVFPVISHYLLILVTIFHLNRENEKNIRLCFYVTREAQIRSEEVRNAMLDSKQLLHNIIPEYALNQIYARGGNLNKGNFSYAVNVKNSAVIFSCISNFFSSYYREDYKGGKGALQLLNTIICMFDDLLKEDKYGSVEKIKTINDCYMVASGLNLEQVAKSKDSKRHLRALLDYSFDMFDTLKIFNEDYVFGKQKFQMKIGYNIGPVTAGVIGTTKPMYDIWGDTVNVSSRMYSTGTPGFVQVPIKVKLVLENYYKFTFKGTTMVKGKGEMETYIVEKKVYNPKV